MFIVSEIKLTKENGIWEDDTMVATEDVEFENLEDAQAFYNRLDPEMSYKDEKRASYHMNPFGYCARIWQEVELDEFFSTVDVIAEKQFTTDDDVELD